MLGPVGYRTGCGDQFDWHSLWVKVGHRLAGRDYLPGRIGSQQGA